MADKIEKEKKRFNALWIILGSIVLVVVVMLIYYEMR
jgi:heme/copper-type cytochrome/quinol oxidase subunit 2